MGFCHTRAVLSSHWAVLGGAPPRDRENWAPRRARGPEPPPGAAQDRLLDGSLAAAAPSIAPTALSIAPTALSIAVYPLSMHPISLRSTTIATHCRSFTRYARYAPQVAYDSLDRAAALARRYGDSSLLRRTSYAFAAS